MEYPKSYHVACNHLIAFGGHNGDTQKGRQLIAKALRDLRRILGAKRARVERKGMLFIAGHFPVKH